LQFLHFLLIIVLGHKTAPIYKEKKPAGLILRSVHLSQNVSVDQVTGPRHFPATSHEHKSRCILYKIGLAGIKAAVKKFFTKSPKVTFMLVAK